MFRFTIRDLLWLMVVVGLACALWADRVAANRTRLDYESRLERIGVYLHHIQATGLLSNENVTYILPQDGGEPILVFKR